MWFLLNILNPLKKPRQCSHDVSDVLVYVIFLVETLILHLLEVTFYYLEVVGVVVEWCHSFLSLMARAATK